MYKAIKKILFKIDTHKVHESALNFGELLGKLRLGNLIAPIFRYSNSNLEQTINGISYKNPIGLAAGFDYNAQLTQIISSIGFGFETVGTITNMPYEGNPKPMLGRLPESKALMVNKGFKNKGIDFITDKLKEYL